MSLPVLHGLRSQLTAAEKTAQRVCASSRPCWSPASRGRQGGAVGCLVGTVLSLLLRLPRACAALGTASLPLRTWRAFGSALSLLFASASRPAGPIQPRVSQGGRGHSLDTGLSSGGSGPYVWEKEAQGRSAP